MEPVSPFISQKLPNSTSTIIQPVNIIDSMSLWRFASFWMYPLLACLLLWCSSASVQGNWISLLLLISGGMLLWSILEYVLHRFVFHLGSPIPFVQKILERLHLGHHADPRNPDRILVRPVYSLPLSAMLLGGLYSFTGTLFSAGGLMIGVWLGFSLLRNCSLSFASD